MVRRPNKISIGSKMCKFVLKYPILNHLNLMIIICIYCIVSYSAQKIGELEYHGEKSILETYN